MEKFRATQAANEIRDEDHAGNAEVVIIGEEGISSSSPLRCLKAFFILKDEFSDQHGRFFSELGSGSAEEELPSSGEDDQLAEEEANR